MTIGQLVRREQTRVRAATVLAAALAGFAASAAVVAAGVLLMGDARWIGRPAAPLVTWMVVLLLAACIGAWARRRLLRSASRAVVAAHIERERSLRAGSLRGVLEVAESGALGRRGAAAMTERLGAGREVLAPSLRRRTGRRGLAAASAAVAAFILLGAARAASPDGWAAIAHPVQAWKGTLLSPIVIVDPPPTVLRGDRVRLLIAAAGRQRVTTAVRTTGAGWQSTELVVDGDSAIAVLGPIDADLTVVASDGRAISDTVIILVTDRPFLGDIALRAIYPAYLHRSAENLPAGEPARVPRGTALEIRGRASTELASVQLAGRADTVNLRVAGQTFSGRISPHATGRWSWVAQGQRVGIADVPVPLEVEVIPDSIPRVEILSPTSDTLVAASDRLLLSIGATDDHGLASVALRSWRRPASGRDQPAVLQRLAADPPSPWGDEVTLELAPRGLEPGDALHLVAVATDNSPWAQTGASRELVIRVPTLSELRELARQTAESAVAGASAAAAAQRDLQRRTADAARSRGERGQRGSESGSSSRARETPLSYQAAEQTRALLQEQRELAEQVEAAQQAAAELERQLQRAGALDTALAQRLREVQQLLRDALTPQMAEQLRQLEQSLQQLSAEEARRQLGDLATQQQRLREQLERSVEMLKRAALEGAMETLRDEAREIAAHEQALADSLARARADSGSARRLADRSSALTQEIAKLADRLDAERAQTGARRTRLAGQHANASAEAMHRAVQQQRAGGPSAERQREAASTAREAGDAMERAAEALAEARAQQIAEWKSELTGELDRAIQEMLQLAREQQELEQKANQGADPSSLRGQQSALQQGVDKAAERLQQAGQKSSLLSARSQGAVGEAREQVSRASDATAQGRRGQAGGAMRDAAEALNRAAASLVQDRDRAARARSASGFAEMLEQLQELAKRQGGLNAQASGLIQMPMSQAAEMSAAARGLANQQRAVARELEQVGDADGSGRTSALAGEARRIAEALESGRIDASVLARQQQLFRRLLDAGRTLEQEERDEMGRREARTATGDERFTPEGRVDRGRDASRFREPTWDELRGLSADERRAVMEYFRRINARTP